MIGFSEFLSQMEASVHTREFVENDWKGNDLEHRVQIYARDDDELLRRLGTTNLRSLSPIVGADYVFWVSEGFHRPFLEILAMIFSGGDYTYPDFFLKHGFGWQISSMAPDTIFCSEKYQETARDKKIFPIFKVRRVQFF